MELTLIDFLAQMVNNNKSRKQGYIACRWLCASDEVKNECKLEAERLFEEWKADELNAKKNRDDMMNNITIKHYD